MKRDRERERGKWTCHVWNGRKAEARPVRLVRLVEDNAKVIGACGPGDNDFPFQGLFPH